jgi:predicted nucleotidyltransferase component of viral defense system
MFTRQDVLAHQSQVPWPALRQVEQDLLLSHSIVAIFSDDFLKSQVAMRGGTLLHKLYLAPAARYSEDIDLVVTGKRPEEHVRAALKRVLKDVLGTHKVDVWDKAKLAVRNAVRPSRVLRLTYEMPAVSESGRVLAIVIEANVTERAPHRPLIELPFQLPFRGAALGAQVNCVELHEMLATKLRALFQRKRGRDLFDLFWAMREGSGVSVKPAAVIESFQHYMRKEGAIVLRDEFLELFDERLADTGFCRDMEPLLRSGLDYDPQAAGAFVRERLLSYLPA